MGGWARGRLDESRVRQTQPSLAGTEAELGYINNLMNSPHNKFMSQPLELINYFSKKRETLYQVSYSFLLIGYITNLNIYGNNKNHCTTETMKRKQSKQIL